MSCLPPQLDRERHLDLRGRGRHLVVRRVALVVLVGVSVLALANVFGQQATTSTAQAGDATLTVNAPEHVRGGLFFQGRFRVDAHSAIRQPTFDLAPGWAEQMQINTIEPSPANETSRKGHLLLSYDRLGPGDQLTVWMQFEANPTGAGRRDQSVSLLDGSQPVATVKRRITVYP